MAISFGGDFDVPRTPDQVYDFLTEPNRFAPLLPDYIGHTMEDATHFTVQVKVGVSHIRGTANVKLELAEAQRPTRAQYKGQGSAAGSNVTVTASFDLVPSGSGTKVNWKGEAQIFGRLASLAGGLLQPVARKNIDKLVGSLRTALSAAAPAPAATSATTISGEAAK